MAEEIKLGPKPKTSRDPIRILKTALRVFEMGDYDCEESVEIAQELWDRAHESFVEEDDDPETDEGSDEKSQDVPKKKGKSISPVTVAYASLVLLILVLGVYKLVKPFVSTDTTCAIIHRPASGCPEGYVQESLPRFTEKDQTMEYACISTDPTKKICTDVLKPGEQETMQFTIPQSVPDDDSVETNRSKVKSKL